MKAQYFLKEIQQNSVVNSIKFMRSGIQFKIVKHIKKQKNITYNQEKNQSLKMCPEIISLAELSDNGIRTASINIFHMCKNVGKKKRTL